MLKKVGGVTLRWKNNRRKGEDPIGPPPAELAGVQKECEEESLNGAGIYDDVDEFGRHVHQYAMGIEVLQEQVDVNKG